MISVSIFGVGLIGGSIASCLKGQPGIKVIGYSNRPASVEKYVQRGVADEGTSSAQEAAEAADFIFLCVPVGMMQEYLDRISTYKLKKGCIVTDVGSTKSSVTAYAESLRLSNAVFI